VFHIVQINVHTPTLIWIKSFFEMPLNQFPNKFVMFLGGAKPKFMYIMRQTTFANGKSKNKCWMDYLQPQMQQVLVSIQLRLIKLSFVKITF
jgi:hypothetical protein